jgi:hypothetical protein
MPNRRSACPKCQTKMTLASVTKGPIGFEHQMFECRSCDHFENVVVALDPTKPNTLGWLAWEVPSAHDLITHSIIEGRMIRGPVE